ncbi:MAG TPA: TIM44-like domain-containing protein [Methylovirgula sp.]|nr:TIM44-like domain-containing protein [Methylovirgula sp.]
MFRAKLLILLLAAGLALGMTGDASARAGMGFSMGSRGYRTYSMPAPTPISPYASPLQRSWTPNRPYTQPNYGTPGYGYSGFGRGFFGGLMGGFLGAGLLGLLFGHGFFGGVGGGFSLLGLLLQLGLIYLLIRFALNFFGNRQPAFYTGQGMGQGAFQGGWAGGYGSQPSGPPLSISAQDYDAFEQRLGEVQDAYSHEDLARLRRLATQEMTSYFAEELQGHARRGEINRVSNVKLLQGNLSEAWREGGAEYATVAMRFSLIDVMVDRSSGRIVSGDPNVPQEVTELWTFVRPAGSGPDAWQLSAIQQV